ncbi:hypothetical protein FACS189429_4910 [Bacteroidia bacterium]|nr:hypothetical protein FACS189429_4910 [Bacteroidia bacterium]
MQRYLFVQQIVINNNTKKLLITYPVFSFFLCVDPGIEHYSQEQKTGLLNIPLSILYHTGGRHKFYSSLGLKLTLPVYSKYIGSNASLMAWGYYPEYDQTEIWQNDFGYGNFSINRHSGKLNLSLSLTGTVETDVKWSFGKSTAVYTGIFVNYCLTNMLKNGYSEKWLIEYSPNNPARLIVNSICVQANRFSQVVLC